LTKSKMPHLESGANSSSKRRHEPEHTSRTPKPDATTDEQTQQPDPPSPADQRGLAVPSPALPPPGHRADPGHHAGDVVAEHERGLVLQEPVELAVADHLVQRVDAGGAHLDQHVTVADLGLGYVGGAESVLAVPLDDECLHDRSPRGTLPGALTGTREPA